MRKRCIELYTMNFNAPIMVIEFQSNVTKIKQCASKVDVIWAQLPALAPLNFIGHSSRHWNAT